MTRTPTLLSYIRHWSDRARAETASDAELLHRFTENRDETAFALLMDRHGPMVLGTARQMLEDEHLAEDVFQAVFLTLAQRARRRRRAAALTGSCYPIDSCKEARVYAR